MSIAYGSTLELETQVILAKKLKLTSDKEFKKLEGILLEVLKMLNSMLGKMKTG